MDSPTMVTCPGLWTKSTPCLLVCMQARPRCVLLLPRPNVLTASGMQPSSRMAENLFTMVAFPGSVRDLTCGTFYRASGFVENGFRLKQWFRPLRTRLTVLPLLGPRMTVRTAALTPDRMAPVRWMAVNMLALKVIRRALAAPRTFPRVILAVELLPRTAPLKQVPRPWAKASPTSESTTLLLRSLRPAIPTLLV